MKFDHYVDELFIIRNSILKENVREFTNGYEKFRYISVAKVNRFVKTILTAIIGGIYNNVAGTIKSKINKHKDNEELVSVLESLLEEFGEPDTSGFRLNKNQQQL